MLVGQTIGEGDKSLYIEKELGSGAMGSVFRARFLKDNTLTALKVIAFGLADNETARARFDREAKILKQLKHPNITRYYGSGHIRKTPFFMMEYVEGESLDHLLERRGKLPWEDVVIFGKQLAAALEHAHEKGIIHRDLKPSNIMLTKGGTVKLTDFGIAKDVDLTALTGANNTIGTAAYMSPEQCRGERNLGPKSDIYSSGVVFYELLTGRKPFVRETSIDLFMAHVNDPFERPSRLVPNLPMWLDTLVCQMLEKKPEFRPLDAATVGRALQEIEDKVASHKSVGAEVANARVIDRIQMTSPPDESDREATRVIRSSSKKKKVKKKTIPFYRKLWFALTLIGLFVIGAGIGLYLVTRPGDPKIAFNQAMEEKDEATKEQLLSAYLKRQSSNKDADWQRANDELFGLKAKKIDQAMWNRVRAKRLNPEEEYDKQAYALVMQGYKLEAEGNTNGALEQWIDLEKNWVKQENEELALWGWIGRRHKQLISEADSLEKRMLATLLRARVDEEEATLDGDDTKRTYEALRLELLGDLRAELSEDKKGPVGDLAGAKQAWKSLRDDREKDKPIDQRVYLILAARHFRDLDPQKASEATPEQREEMVRGLLKWALSVQKSENLIVLRDMRNTLRDIRDLYKNAPSPLDKIAIEADSELRKLKK